MRLLFALAAFLLLAAFAPAVALARPPAAPIGLAAKTEGLAALCTARLHLDNTQAAMLRYYLQDQMHTLQLEVEGGALSAQSLPVVGRQRLVALAGQLLAPQQLADFGKLLASPEALPHLRALALASN